MTGFQTSSAWIHPTDNIRNRSAALVLAVDMTQVSEDILREFLLDNIVRLELDTPFESLDEHFFSIIDIQISFRALDQLPELSHYSLAYLARKNFMSTTLARASGVPFGSISTPQSLIFSGLSDAYASSTTLVRVPCKKNGQSPP